MNNNTFIENNKIITIITYLLFFLSAPVYADFTETWENASPSVVSVLPTWPGYEKPGFNNYGEAWHCLLYTSDAADE